MAKIEIDENEYAELKRVADVAQMIGKNPEARQRLQEAVAIAAPDQAGPEIRIRKEVTERIGGIESKLDEFLAAQKQEREERAADAAKARLENQWSETRRKARDAGYTDEGLEKLEAFMEENGIANHELAIPAFEKLNPPPEPVVTGGSRWNFFEPPADGSDAAMKALMESGGNDESALTALINSGIGHARGR
jgi:hypothetical protein